jgi:hypothetical protein
MGEPDTLLETEPPRSQTFHCAFCLTAVDFHDPDIYRETTQWITGEKRNKSAVRVYTGQVACADCITAMKAGQHPSGGTLFDETEPQVNLRHWNPGFEAGWRGDKFITTEDKHPDWITGYHAGMTAKENVG